MFRITDYFYTPKDIVRALRIKHALGITAGVFVMAGLKYVGVGLDVSIFVTAIVTALIWELDARVPFVGAIVCFLLIMVASVVNPDTTSTAGIARERLAVFAFYFLVIGVVLLVREHIKPHETAAEQQVEKPKISRKNHSRIAGKLAVKHGLVAPVKTRITQTAAMYANRPVAATPRHTTTTPRVHSQQHVAPNHGVMPQHAYPKKPAFATPNGRTKPQLLDLRAAVPRPASVNSVRPQTAHGVHGVAHTKINDIRPQPLFQPSGKKPPQRIQL